MTIGPVCLAGEGGEPRIPQTVLDWTLRADVDKDGRLRNKPVQAAELRSACLSLRASGLAV
jgi:hypothetical protein